MKVKVTKEAVLIIESTTVNEGELRVNVCDFVLPECFNGLSVTAMFNNIPVPLTGTQCYIPALKSGTAVLGVYAYAVGEGTEPELMYSPKPACFFVNRGSYSERVNVEESPSVSEFEKYCAAVSALTFPKSDVVSEVDLEKEFTQTQVYSAGALNSALIEVGEVISAYVDDLSALQGSTEKVSRKVTVIDSNSTDLQYPSAAAVYRGFCQQSAEIDQVKSELLSDMVNLAENVRLTESGLKAEIKAVDNRVTQTSARLDSAASAQNMLSGLVSNIQEEIPEIKSKADLLENEIQHNESSITQLSENAVNVQNTVEALASSLDDVRDMVNSRVTDNANAIKGEKTGVGYVSVDDVSPLTHYLDVTVSGDGASESIISCHGKNMLTFEGRVPGDFNAEGHGFSGNNIYLAVSGSGYYKNNSGSWSYDSATDTYTVSCVNSWYGPGIDFRVSPGEKYAVSWKSLGENIEVHVSFYDGNGDFLSYLSTADKRDFTVPAGAKWMVIIFTSRTKNNTGDIVCPQLERGATPTDYERAVAVQTATPDSSGRISSFTSNSPTVVVSSDNPALNISCKYNRDTQKAYEELVNAVLALGGSL